MLAWAGKTAKHVSCSPLQSRVCCYSCDHHINHIVAKDCEVRFFQNPDLQTNLACIWLELAGFKFSTLKKSTIVEVKVISLQNTSKMSVNMICSIKTEL